MSTKTTKYVVMIGIMAVTLLMPNVAFASTIGGRDLTEKERESGMYNEDGYTLSQSSRPAINPDFDPDESCLFDVFQVQCIPGSQQECSEDFGNNDDYTCFPLDENGDWTCPEGYHGTDDDETGQCYPNDEGCQYDDSILLTDRPGKDDRCAALYAICDIDEYTSDERVQDACVEFCEEDPDRFGCRPDPNLN
ncbi:MAG: hypothetical protein ACREAS_08165 [Nitrososphaera sp.]